MSTLDALSRGESATSARRLPPWVIPLAILAGFSLIFLLLFRDRLLPAAAVEVEQVVALSTSTTNVDADATDAARPNPAPSGGGSVLFQASGWIEPDPYLTKATALIGGVVDEVHVLEGDLVEEGQLLATLVDDDAELALRSARERLEQMEAQRQAHCAGIQRTIKEMETKQAEEKSAESLHEEARDQLDRLEGLSRGAVSERDRVEARLAVTRLEALATAAGGRVQELVAELSKAAYETLAMEKGIAGQQVAVEEAELAYQRTRITAPIAGRVLELFVAPGQKRMLDMDDPDSSTIVTLYDPAKLQVRVDVPLADAAALRVGQAARIRCNLLPDRVFDGRVTRIAGEADLQRNTLQAKVALFEPIDALRPEMLCRVEFLDGGRVLAQDGGSGPTGGRGAGSLDVWMPEAAVHDGGAWVVDPEARKVDRRELELGGETRDGRVRVGAGVRPGEWVVISPQGLREGQRVKVKGGLP